MLEVFRVFDHRLSLHSRPMGGIRKCTAGPRSSEGTWCWRCAYFAMFFIANLVGLFWLYWQAAKQALTLAREVRDIDLIGQVLQALWGSCLWSGTPPHRQMLDLPTLVPGPHADQRTGAMPVGYCSNGGSSRHI